MNNINIWIVLAIIFIHWIADFVLQTDLQAKNKSRSNYWLMQHTQTYSIIWLLIGSSYSAYAAFFENLSIKEWSYQIFLASIFTIITFIFHTATDYFTSRLNTKLWNKGDVHNFFVSVGFDQVLHYIQLFLTYTLLKQFI
jgi:hypothetical protein